MSLFCYIARSFSNRRYCVSFTLQLIWGNVSVVSVVARIFTLSFVPQIVLNKLKTTSLHNSLFSNLTTFVSWKNIVLENRERHCYYSDSIVCFHHHLHFLGCLQRLQAQQNKFCTCEKPNFSLNKKKCTATSNKHRQFVH